MLKRIRRARSGFGYSSNHHDVGVGGSSTDMDESKHVIEDDMDTSKHDPGSSSDTGANHTVLYVEERVEAMGLGPAPSLPIPPPPPLPAAPALSAVPTAETGIDQQSARVASPPRKRDGDGEFPPSFVRSVKFGELSQPFKLLGSGEFCSAYLTTLDGQQAVVKMLKPDQQNNPTAATDLRSEVHLMTSMKHPHVLRAIAMGTDPAGFPFLVLEKLDTVLSAELPKASDSVPFWTRRSQVKKWPITRALRVARELADAMHYCHHAYYEGCRVLHRDLKPNNIGFMPDGRLVLFDFGLAKLWRISEGDDGTEARQLTGNTGSLRYMAPEVALSRPYSHKAEIFAFGTLLWQMIAHEVPFQDCDVSSFYRRVCHQGERPRVPDKVPAALRQLLKECWDADPNQRPDTRDIMRRLDDAIAALPKGR